MRKGARTLLIAILVVVGALIAGGAALWYRVGESGTSDLEQWLGRQVVGIIEAHITPRVAFESVDYQAPKTVVVTGLDVSTNGTSLITVKRLLLELAPLAGTATLAIESPRLDEVRLTLDPARFDFRLLGARQVLLPATQAELLAPNPTLARVPIAEASAPYALFQVVP